MLKQHVLLDLKQFVYTVSAHGGNAKKLTALPLIRNSLRLLEDLPAAREIIFEYFALVAEISVQNYVLNSNIDTQTGLPIQQASGSKVNQMPADDDSFAFIQEALENLLSKGPVAWGPVVASWSLDLVANLSNKFTKRKMSIAVACNFWLNCSTMRGLLTLISICFRKLTNVEAESCVETLLVAFQRYTLTFDWVVARLGGCFPLKIISQILQYSLKRFAEDYRCRLDSEVGVLDYLSFAHEQELKVAIHDLLNEGFQPKKSLDASVIPFMMQLCNYSDTLLQNVIGVFLDMYNEDLRATIIQKAPLWMSNKLFAEMQPSLNNLVLRLKAHGAKLLLVTAKMAEQYSWCQDFLEFSLQELEQVILNARMCPLIDDVATEESKYLLWKSCISANVYEQQTAVRLLLIVSTQHSQIYYQTISELLRKSYTANTNGIGALIRLMGGQSGVVEFPEIKPGLQMVLEDVLLQEQFQHTRSAMIASKNAEALNTFKNLNILTIMQKKNCLPCLRQNLLKATLNECLAKILQILEVTLTKLVLNMDKDFAQTNEAEISHEELIESNRNTSKHVRLMENMSEIKEEEMKCDEDNVSTDSCSNENEKHANRLLLAHTVVDLLNAIEAGAKSHVMRTTEILKLAILTSKYFFIGLTEKTSTQRLAAMNQAFALMQRQCFARKAARTACLRELIEGALFYYGYLFGQNIESELDELEIPEHEMVLLQNQRQSLGPNVNRTVLHAGVIGRGLRPGASVASEHCDFERQSLLLKALDACCMDIDKQNAIEGYSMISLMLVEMVSTDVMYNGLPFPDEEFTKVTMERDLLIRRAFINSPILWALLSFIAMHRPALCFSSVLLRALCATCLHQWRAKNVNKFDTANTNDELMQCTQKLLKVLAMGQLLPTPLSHLHMIIEHFEAPEIALLLKECVWNYLKDHVPSPALFHVDANGLHWRNASLATKVPSQYVDTLRNLMQKKLTKLGHHYYQMFIMSELNPSVSTTDSIAQAQAISKEDFDVQKAVVQK